MRKFMFSDDQFERRGGRMDANMKSLEKALEVRVSARGNEIFIDGDEEKVTEAEKIISKLTDLLQNGYAISEGDVRTAAGLMQKDPDVDLGKFFLANKIISSSKKNVVPKSFNQKRY